MLPRRSSRRCRAGANLGFLYATDALARRLGGIAHAVCASGPASPTGSAASVLGICASGIENPSTRPALAVMAAALPADSFRVFAADRRRFRALRRRDGVLAGAASRRSASSTAIRAQPTIAETHRRR